MRRSARALRKLSCLLPLLALLGCGGGAQASRDLRAQLATEEARALRQHAPDLVAAAESALDAADRAAGNADAAADHVTRARLHLDAARTEVARIEDDAARVALEGEISAVLARARRDEVAREALGLELARRASARTADEEAARALAEAEGDESRPGRRRRVGLEEAATMRQAAAVLRDRASMLLSAARALGADDAARRDAEAALEASRAATDPEVSVREADRARHAALLVLGAARAAREEAGPDAPRALAEAAIAEGFTVDALAEGMTVSVPGVFSGAGAAPSASARARLGRLAALLAAFPHGPVSIRAPAGRPGAAGATLARQRATALARALVEDGVSAARVELPPAPASVVAENATQEARLTFVAYAP